MKKGNGTENQRSLSSSDIRQGSGSRFHAVTPSVKLSRHLSTSVIREMSVNPAFLTSFIT